MNVQNLMKQCEMVIKLSNGATNNELDFVYQTAQRMVEAGNGKSHQLIFRELPDEINLDDVCNLMRNLRVWHFYVIADISQQFRWRQCALLRDIVQIGNEYAIKYRA